jgi:hypothetical protein
VTYDKTTCRLTADVTIHAQDFNNFNLRGRDIASGSLAAENGRFEVLGWARSFFNQASVQRTITWDPPCCADADCPTSNSFTCKCNECLVQCPVTQKSGGQGEFTFAIDVKNTTGRIDVFYNMYRVPDELQMFHEDQFLYLTYLTGGLVSGWGRPLRCPLGPRLPQAPLWWLIYRRLPLVPPGSFPSDARWNPPLFLDASGRMPCERGVITSLRVGSRSSYW